MVQIHPVKMPHSTSFSKGERKPKSGGTDSSSLYVSERVSLELGLLGASLKPWDSRSGESLGGWWGICKLCCLKIFACKALLKPLLDRVIRRKFDGSSGGGFLRRDCCFHIRSLLVPSEEQCNILYLPPIFPSGFQLL